MESYQNYPSAPVGSSLLRVTGILMIIFSAITLVFGLIGLFGLLTLSAMAGVGALMLVIVLGYILFFTGAVLEFVAGIVAVKNWANPAKAHACMGWGVTLLVLASLSLLLALLGSGTNGVTAVIGIVLPILYIVGVNQLKQQA